MTKADTGLPVNIWLDYAHLYRRGGHGKRLKFQNDYGNSINENNLLTMTISKDPQVIEEESKIKLRSKDIKLIKKFVVINYNLLSDLADQKITWKTFVSGMKTV